MVRTGGISSDRGVEAAQVRLSWQVVRAAGARTGHPAGCRRTPQEDVSRALGEWDARDGRIGHRTIALVGLALPGTAAEPTALAMGAQGSVVAAEADPTPHAHARSDAHAGPDAHARPDAHAGPDPTPDPTPTPRPPPPRRAAALFQPRPPNRRLPRRTRLRRRLRCARGVMSRGRADRPPGAALRRLPRGPDRRGRPHRRRADRGATSVSPRPPARWTCCRQVQRPARVARRGP